MTPAHILFLRIQKSAAEESDHAQKFMAFQNKRGGRVVLKDIKKPDQDEWGSGLEAMKAALDLEKQVRIFGIISTAVGDQRLLRRFSFVDFESVIIDWVIGFLSSPPRLLTGQSIHH